MTEKRDFIYNVNISLCRVFLPCAPYSRMT